MFLTYTKPHWIPTTFWQEECFLEWIIQREEIYQKKNLLLWPDCEYGLLTRLDNETAWSVLFAQTMEEVEWYKEKQKNHEITKHYLCRVYGRVPRLFSFARVPLAHHRDDKKRVVYQGQNQAWRWKRRQSVSFFEVCEYDEETDTTLLDVLITRWMRHQIRVHAQSLWYSVVNDTHYAPKKLRKRYNTRLQAVFGKDWGSNLWLVCVWYSSEKNNYLSLLEKE